MLSACSVYYTGNTAHRLKKANGEFLVKPNQRKYNVCNAYPKLGQGKNEHNDIFEVFPAVTVKNVFFWNIKFQFVLYRKHITSPL
jgi:hypothetical protein